MFEMNLSDADLNIPSKVIALQSEQVEVSKFCATFPLSVRRIVDRGVLGIPVGGEHTEPDPKSTLLTEKHIPFFTVLHFFQRNNDHLSSFSG